MSHRISPLVLAAFIGAAPGMASADARASARLTDFGYSLIDLNPGDGIAPAVTFNVEWFEAGLEIQAEQTFADASGGPLGGTVTRLSRWISHFQFFPEISRSAALPSVEGSVTMSGAVADHRFSTVVLGEARSGSGDGIFSNQASVRAFPASGGEALSTQITPFTELVWTGHLSLAAEKTTHLPGTRFGASFANANFTMLDRDANITGFFEDRVSTFDSPPGLQTSNNDFRLSLANNTSEAAFGYLFMNMNVLSQTALIPEPGTPWLMLGGLGVLAWISRRRQGARLRRAAVPALAALTALAGGPAQADVSARASVTGFGYSLIDLNPGDGIAPGIQFLLYPGVGQSGSQSQSEFFYPTGQHGEDVLIDTSAMLLDLATSIASPRATASARMGGTPADHGYAYSAEGQLSNSAATSATSLRLGFLARSEPANDPFGPGTSFRLTPFTQVVWAGEYSMRFESTVGRAGGNDEVGSTRVFGAIYDTDSQLVDEYAHAFEILEASKGVKTESGTLRLSFANDSADFGIARLLSGVQVAGRLQPSVAPIPEPGTWGLLLCGLGVVGTAARRHGAQGRPHAASA